MRSRFKTGRATRLCEPSSLRPGAGAFVDGRDGGDTNLGFSWSGRVAPEVVTILSGGGEAGLTTSREGAAGAGGFTAAPFSLGLGLPGRVGGPARVGLLGVGLVLADDTGCFGCSAAGRAVSPEGAAGLGYRRISRICCWRGRTGLAIGGFAPEELPLEELLDLEGETALEGRDVLLAAL